MMTATPQYEKGNLYQLSIADLRPDPEQPRKAIDPVALDDLKASIQEFGILTPILFRAGEGGWLVIVSGERRYQAAMALGMTTVPGICVDGKYAEIALVENLQRQDLTAVEEAEALERLMTQESYTQEQLSAIAGKARSTVGDILSINKLPDVIRDECRGDHAISRNVLIAISRRKQERSMLSSYAAYRASLEKKVVSHQRKDPNDPATVLGMIEKLANKFDLLDTAAWSEEEATGVAGAVSALRRKLDALFPEAAGGPEGGLS